MDSKLLIFLLLLLPVSVEAQVKKPDNKVKRSNSGEFEYPDCGCAGNIDLKLYKGLDGSYGGNLVPDADEWSKGELTVANQNDTDGDGIIDNIDMSVKASISIPGSRDEVDLMKLEVTISGTFPASCPAVELVLTGSVEIWEQPTKETKASKLIPISSLPKTVWVEAIAPSGSVRDIEIKALIGTSEKDKVRATAVWVEFDKKYIVKGLAGSDNSSAAGLDINEQTVVGYIEGLYKDNPGRRLGGSIEIAFQFFVFRQVFQKTPGGNTFRSAL